MLNTNLILVLISKVRRTTRVVRSTKDNENANARPSRIVTTRSKTLAGATGTSATTRATASTAASKAKAVIQDAKDEKEAGIKRKREVLVEVTGLVTNNKIKVAGTVAKGKEGSSSSTDKLKNAAIAATTAAASAKPQAVVKPPSRRLVGAAVPRRVLTRASSESTTASKAEKKVPVAVKPKVEPIQEKMEVDAVAEDEEAQRVFKRRHTNEKPIVHAKFLDDSQVSQAEADRIANELQAVERSSANAQLWDDLDAEDLDDPIMVSEYVVDVCKYLKDIEVRTPSKNQHQLLM